MEKVKEYLKTKQDLCKTVSAIKKADSEASVYINYSDKRKDWPATVIVITKILTATQLDALANKVCGYDYLLAEEGLSEFGLVISDVVSEQHTTRIDTIIEECLL